MRLASTELAYPHSVGSAARVEGLDASCARVSSAKASQAFRAGVQVAMVRVAVLFELPQRQTTNFGEARHPACRTEFLELSHCNV